MRPLTRYGNMNFDHTMYSQAPAFQEVATNIVAPIANSSAGATPDSIAAHLRSLGIKGKRNSGCDCPVAIWLSGAFGQRGEVGECAFKFSGSPLQLDFGSPLVEFVNRFDAGEYPDLVADEMPLTSEGERR
jgi:hypothetical protein